MTRPRHPSKEIEKAVQYGESLGWRVQMSKGHAWGLLLCPEKSQQGCRISVNSTPRSPQNHAQRIRKQIDTCLHNEK